MTIVTTIRTGVSLDVDTAAIEWNTRVIASRVRTPMLAVVKADGYGHGLVTMASAAVDGGAVALGVTGLDDAARLRAAGITTPVLSWMNPDGIDADTAVAFDTALAVASVEQLRASARTSVASTRGPVSVHLQLDTGMARDGAPEETWTALALTAARLEARGVIRVDGVMSHLAHADEPGHPATTAALAAFDRGLALIRAAGLRPRHVHLAATSAALTDPRTRGSLVRIGAGLVGVDLSGSTTLRPAMRLRARIIETREVRAGSSSGYGGTWTADEDTVLGLVPLGYGDGIPRVESGSAHVTIHGEHRRVVGVVSMNALVVDLGRSGAGVGDAVVVLGDPALGEPTAIDWARWAGTIPQDVLTSIGRSGRRTTI
jgi:alanine racemase